MNAQAPPLVVFLPRTAYGASRGGIVAKGIEPRWPIVAAQLRLPLPEGVECAQPRKGPVRRAPLRNLLARHPIGELEDVLKQLVVRREKVCNFFGRGPSAHGRNLALPVQDPFGLALVGPPLAADVGLKRAGRRGADVRDVHRVHRIGRLEQPRRARREDRLEAALGGGASGRGGRAGAHLRSSVLKF